MPDQTTGPRRHRILAVAALAAAAAAAVAVGFLLTNGQHDARLAVLRLERQALGRSLDELANLPGPLLPPGGVLATVGEDALTAALTELLPWEGTFGAVTVRLERAVVRFRRGMAVLDLEGTATPERPALPGGPNPAPTDVSVVAVLYVDRMHQPSGALRTRVEVLGFRSAGSDTRVGTALDRVAEEVFREVSQLLGGIELPLGFTPDIELPAVDDDDVTIPAARLPLDLAVRRVLVLDGRIWVALTSGFGTKASSEAPIAGDEPHRNEGDIRRCDDTLLDHLHPACPSFRQLRDVRWLEARVTALADSLTRRLDADSAAVAVRADPGDVVVRMDTRLLVSLVVRGTLTYLDSLDLHIADDVEVDEDGDVSTGVGPLSIPLGSWQVRVTIQGIRAVLRAERPVVEVADRNRLSLRLPVQVGRARARARLRFGWDASAVPGLLCEDFDFDEAFEATVPPSSHDVVGYFEFRNEGGQLVADPEQTNEVRIHPEAGPEAWQAVRAVLEERDGFFDCGMGIDADDMERRLRELLAEGFEFALPESLLRPIPIPVRIRRAGAAGGGDMEVTLRPATLDLRPSAFQYSVRVSAGVELDPP